MWYYTIKMQHGCSNITGTISFSIKFCQLKLNKNYPYPTGKGDCNNVVAKIFNQECIPDAFAKLAPNTHDEAFKITLQAISPQLYQKGTPLWVFSWEFVKFYQKSFFFEHIWTTSSEPETKWIFRDLKDLQ